MTRQNYNPMNLARSAAEGVALEFGHNLERIMELGFEPKQIHVAGDWSRSRVWRQLVSNVFGLPVAAVKGGEGAALGRCFTIGGDLFCGEWGKLELPRNRGLCS